jgi:two-component system sensor histidine kinase DesK
MTKGPLRHRGAASSVGLVRPGDRLVARLFGESQRPASAAPDRSGDAVRRVLRVAGPVVALAIWASYAMQPIQAVSAGTAAATASIVAQVLLTLVFAGVVVIGWPVRRASVPRWLARAIVSVEAVLVGVACIGALEAGLVGLVFVCVSAVFLFRDARALWVLLASATVVAVLPRRLGWQPDDGLVVTLVLTTVAALGFVLLVERNRELRAAQEEIAALAVAGERDRIARDMHDVLGHSLTVVALKAELAGKLLDSDPERARAEIADVEALARTTLADARAMVSRSHAVTLAGEIAGAREAFDTAGIAADLPGSIDVVPERLRELFAWAVREGTTNVLRHSEARTVRVTMTGSSLVMDDDGHGALAGASPGNGLRGLRERAARAGASVSVAASPLGGFRLVVRGVPDEPTTTSHDELRTTSHDEPLNSSTTPSAASVGEARQ